MAGIERPLPLELVSFSQTRPHTFNSLLCDGVTAYNLASYADLMVLHTRLQHEHPGCRVLATLEDLGQACYTSGHGTDVYGLDSIEGHDLSGLSAELFEDGTHRGYLSTQAEFPIRLANLLKQASAVDLSQISGVLAWESPGEPHDLVTINDDPDLVMRLGDEQQILFQFVPVVAAADAIAAFPNGYFTADLNPMQNHALARHLEATYGLALFGIGARFLGFRCPQPLDADRATALVTELATLYRGGTQAAQDRLTRLLTNRDWLLLRYTES